MPVIILSIVSIVILIIAGFFFWVDWDGGYKSGTDGFGGCLALGLVGVVLAIWIIYAFLATLVSIFT